MEPAQPPEVVSLVAAVHGLTAREADVLAEVLAGHPRDVIAGALNISPYTVQDHLKSIFTKTGTQSRQTLVSHLVFDQYLPRMGAPVGPRDWFVDSRRPCWRQRAGTGTRTPNRPITRQHRRRPSDVGRCRKVP